MAPLAVAVSLAPAASAAGPATQLLFTIQPSAGALAGFPLGGPAVTVADAAGNPVTTDASTVTLTITGGTPTSGGGTLSGCSQAETNGVITFSGCVISGVGVGYKLHATDGALTAADSNAFTLTNDTLAAAGADVTGNVMTDIVAGTGAINVKTPNQLGTNETTVPGDSHCNDVTYNATGTGTDSHGNNKIIAPKVAQDGVDALNNSVAGTYPTGTSGFAYAGLTVPPGGCIDIARSSSLNKNPSTLEDYSFAVDAVTWATTSLNAPAALSLQDLRDIWNCKINDWSQVGGAPGPITRVLPPFGSGTRKYFINNVLNISTETNTVAWSPPNSGVLSHDGGGLLAGANITCPNTVTVNEQSNGAILSSTSALKTGLATYILPYSAGNWVAQARKAGNPTLDIRGGTRPGGLVGTATTGTFPVAYTERWTGSDWYLNNAQILGANASSTRSVTVTIANALDTVLTSPTCAFLPADVGYNLQETPSTHIFDGTTILSVSADGCTATIDTVTKASGTATALLGWAVVSEKNPNLLTANFQFPGVRYVYNIIRPDEPDYLAARAIIGFDVTSSTGNVSPLCNGADIGIINSAGFLDLPKIVGPGNNNPVTCRKQ